MLPQNCFQTRVTLSFAVHVFSALRHVLFDCTSGWGASPGLDRTARSTVLAEGLQEYLSKLEVVAKHPIVGARDKVAVMVLACACLVPPAVAAACSVAQHGQVHARVHTVVLEGLAEAHALGGVLAAPPLTCI